MAPPGAGSGDEAFGVGVVGFVGRTARDERVDVRIAVAGGAQHLPRVFSHQRRRSGDVAGGVRQLDELAELAQADAPLRFSRLMERVEGVSQKSLTKVLRAKAEAQEITLLAKAHAAEKSAETQTLTPLAVAMHAYDALGKLGGEGTQIMLGDWSRTPRFLFPGGGFAGLGSANGNPYVGAGPTPAAPASVR